MSVCDTSFSMSNGRYESVGADTQASTLENMLIILGQMKGATLTRGSSSMIYVIFRMYRMD